MAQRHQIESGLHELLRPDTFEDYGPNGLQVEGRPEVRSIVSGVTASLDFIDAAERAIKRISRGPLVGSLRFAYELNIPDLRAWPLQRFPYVVFYVVTDVEIDVWRILHTRRDVPATLEPPET